jgi:hypothetical protein
MVAEQLIITFFHQLLYVTSSGSSSGRDQSPAVLNPLAGPQCAAIRAATVRGRIRPHGVLAKAKKQNDLDGNQNVGPMKIPIKLGDEVLYPDAVLLIKDRDSMVESVYRGKSAVEVIAKNILCNSIENRAELQLALTEGWEFFCAILPSGYPRFWLKDAKWLEAAEKIAVSIDKECLRKMPGSTVKQ